MVNLMDSVKLNENYNDLTNYNFNLKGVRLLLKKFYLFFGDISKEN